MERKNWLVLAIIILSVGLIVMIASAASTSAATAKENPYEYWIEPSEIENLSIRFVYQALYKTTAWNTSCNVSDNFSGPDILFLNFNKGSWNSETYTFEAKNEINKTGGFLSQKCKLVFNPGINEIENFEIFGAEKKINDEPYNYTSQFMRINISGLKLPRAETWETIRKDKVTTFQLAKNKTLFGLNGAETCNSIKDIKVRGYYTYCSGIRTLSLTKYYCDNNSFVHITFDGCLPKLPDYEGKCSWFGGENDTGVDVTLRKEFYQEQIGGEYNAKLFKENKQFNEEFQEWMNKPAQKCRWERTGLGCGPARNLDTENDYFCAMRWQQPYPNEKGFGHQSWWRKQKIKVTNSMTNKSVVVRPVDWGPHESTGRVIDLSLKAMNDIGAGTDHEVEICWEDQNAPLELC